MVHSKVSVYITENTSQQKLYIINGYSEDKPLNSQQVKQWEPTHVSSHIMCHGQIRGFGIDVLYKPMIYLLTDLKIKVIT